MARVKDGRPRTVPGGIWDIPTRNVKVQDSENNSEVTVEEETDGK